MEIICKNTENKPIAVLSIQNIDGIEAVINKDIQIIGGSE